MSAKRFIAQRRSNDSLEVCDESTIKFAGFFIRPRRAVGYQPFRTGLASNPDGQAKLAILLDGSGRQTSGHYPKFNGDLQITGN